MPPKKKGKKGKKAKKEKNVEQPVSNFKKPVYKDPELYTPRVDLHIKLKEPAHSVMTFDLQDVMITTSTHYIIKQIQYSHQGAIGGVSIYNTWFTKECLMDPMKTLEENGINGDKKDIDLYYDFEPIKTPILY